MPTTPQPEQPIPVPKPDVVRPPTPLEEPQPEKGPDLPQPGPDVVIPPAPEVIDALAVPELTDCWSSVSYGPFTLAAVCSLTVMFGFAFSNVATSASHSRC